MKRSAVACASMLALYAATPALAVPVPDGEFAFSYRQVSDGKPGEGIHQVSLRCNQGRCLMSTLSLNQCFMGSFYPKVELAFSGTELLTVTSPAEGTIVVRQDFGQTVLTYRLTVDKRGSLGYLVTDVTGAGVKNSEILQDVVTWKIQHIKGEARRVAFNCAALVDGPE